MAVDMARTPQQAHWDEHSTTLKRIRNTFGEDDDHTPRRSKQSFQPLSDAHPLLQGSHSHRSSNSPPVVHRSPRVATNGNNGTPPPPRGRHSRTPPSRLPRMITPPDHRHEAKVRGVHFDILPTVRNPGNGYENGYDSWGDDAESDSEGDYDYPAYPYPVVMYPMVLPPHHQQRRKPKDKSKKKRVRYRNTPVLLDSRENTLHEPQQIHDFYSTYSYDNPERYPYDTYDGGGISDSPDFSYIATSHQPHQYDPFNPRMNPVLARYQVPTQRRERDYSPVPTVRRMSPDLIPTSSECFKYLEDNPLFTRVFIESVLQDCLVDSLLPEALNEALDEEKLDVQRGPKRESPAGYNPEPSYFGHNALESLLTDLIDEVVNNGCDDVVKDTMVSMVDTHLEKAAVYDIAVDLVNEHIELTVEDVAGDAVEEVFYENFLEEFIIAPVLEEEAREIVTGICDNYNNKKRRADLRQVKRDTGDKLLDSLCLDYILALAARQGKIWTEGEHANKLFDNVILSIILEQMADVDKKRRSNVNAKPVRRHQEKMVTDVAVDVLLEELCQSLDEDMADLDEYEMGLENTEAKAKYSDLEHLLTGL